MVEQNVVSYVTVIDVPNADLRLKPGMTATVTVEGSSLTVDFAGSGPQTKGGINMTPSFRDSYTHLAIRCYLDPDIPQNQGCFAPVTICRRASVMTSTWKTPVRPA